MLLTSAYRRFACPVLFALLIGALGQSIQSAEPTKTSKTSEEQKISPEEAAVRDVVNQHIQGIVKADVELLEQAWDTQAGKITFVTRNDKGEEVAQSAPITDSIKLWTASKRPGTKGTIESVDIVHGKMALAKAQITWNRQVFDDYLVLLKTDGKWKMVSKTYTSRSASASPYGVIGTLSP